MIQIDGKDYWLWIAYEPNLDLLFDVHTYIKRKRTIFVCYKFFKELRKRFGRKIIFTDGARWYIIGLQRIVKLNHQVYGNERFIQKIELNVLIMIAFYVEGINAIYNMYNNWSNLFVLYLYVGTNGIRFVKLILVDGG